MKENISYGYYAYSSLGAKGDRMPCHFIAYFKQKDGMMVLQGSQIGRAVAYTVSVRCHLPRRSHGRPPYVYHS